MVERKKAAARDDPPAAALPGTRLTPLTWPEIVLATACLTFWFLLFVGGSLISTQPYRDQLQSSLAWQSRIKPLVVCILFWTTSNIGLLACLSSVLGAIGFRCRFTETFDLSREPGGVDANVPGLLLTSYLAAIMRGFGTYTLSLAGLLLVASETLTSPDQVSYLRLAPLVSIASFYSGFNPRTFGGLLNRVKDLMQTKPGGGSTDNNPPASGAAATSTSQRRPDGS